MSAAKATKKIGAVRAQVSDRVRFEVFKRDKFTCQYCGRAAPDVVLNCDHITPVAKGGTGDVLNLITSCRSCNGGKGAVSLSDDTAVQKQRAALADLEERRQQIEMMVRWRDGMQDLADAAVDAVVQRLGDRGGWEASETGKSEIRRWLKKHSLADVLRAVDEALDTYLKYQGDEPTQESWGHAFSKVAGICRIQDMEVTKPYIRRLFYIQGIIRKRTRMWKFGCLDYLEHIHLCGMSVDKIEQDARRISTWREFEEAYDAWLDRVGKPF